MTGTGRPVGMLAGGRAVTRLLTAGMPMGPLRLLQTRGRRSDRPRVVPVAVLRHDGGDWLVSPFGEVAWVHNVRANGEAVLTRRGRALAVRMVEVTDERVPVVLRAYRRRFAMVPFVRAAFEPAAGDDLAVYARVASRHPVFRIDPPPLDAPPARH